MISGMPACPGPSFQKLETIEYGLAEMARRNLYDARVPRAMREYLREPMVYNFVRDLEATGAVGLKAGRYAATDVRVVLFKAKRETWKAPFTQYAEAEAERWTRRIKSALEMNN